MKIRALEPEDINDVVDLWYDTSVVAHSFISSVYWLNNKKIMANEYLPNSETYLAVEENDEIIGFISMVKNYLAAIFIKPDEQGKGIGYELLNYVKTFKKDIQLKVYKKNVKAVSFYSKNGFKKLSEDVENETGEPEYIMVWKR